MVQKVKVLPKNTNVELENTASDLYAKEIIHKGAHKFFARPAKTINKNDYKIAKKVLSEIEDWELSFSDKKFSILKNDSVLVAYLAYKFGELFGLDEESLSNVYIAGLVQNIGKMYMCGENKKLAYKYNISSLKSGEKGFEKIAKALKQIPIETRKYLRDRTQLNDSIVDSASDFRYVYSTVFKEGFDHSNNNISQLESVLWFAESLSALSFSSIESLERNYKKGTYVSLLSAIDLLKEQTEAKIPEFWSKTTSTNLISLVFTMIMTMSSPSKLYAANYNEEQVIAITNQNRKSQNIGLLAVDAKLMQAAINKAQHMFDEQYWSHYGPGGETPWQFITAQGYSYVYAGENLAKNFSSLEAMNSSLLNSPEHRGNILDPQYDEIGVAVMDGVLAGENVTIVVQMFASETPVPEPKVPPKVVEPIEKTETVPVPQKAEENVPSTVSLENVVKERTITEDLQKEVENLKTEDVKVPSKETRKETRNVSKIEFDVKEDGDKYEKNEKALLVTFNDFIRRAKITLKKKENE